MAFAVLLAAPGCRSPRSARAERKLPAATTLASIALKSADGSTLVLADPSTWGILPDDQERVLSWQAGDLVEIRKGVQSGQPAALTNLEEGTRVLAEPREPFSL